MPEGSINLKKLGAWLDERKAKSACPICDQKGWSMLNDGWHVGNAIPFGDGKGDMFIRGFPVLTMFCNNCHFVKQIALDKRLLAEVSNDEPK